MKNLIIGGIKTVETGFKYIFKGKRKLSFRKLKETTKDKLGWQSVGEGEKCPWIRKNMFSKTN